MKKVIALVCLVAILVVALVSCGPNFDSMKSKLEKEGYKVVLADEKEIEAVETLIGSKGSVKNWLSAFKLTASVTVVEFKDQKSAEAYETKLNSKVGVLDVKTERSGNTVYSGSEEAIKIVK